MITYYLLYLYLSLNSLISRKFSIFTGPITLFIFVIFIGLRHEIGVDWINYSNYMNNVGDSLLMDIILSGHELGFFIINWIGSQANSIYLLNTIASIVFLSGLFRYCKRQSYPWLSLIFAFPILILPVGLGLTRQSCAVGVIFFALNAIDNQKIIKSIFLILLAATFHFSSIFLIVLYIPYFFQKNNSKFKLNLVLFLCGVLFFILYGYISTVITSYSELYIINKFELSWSSGGSIPKLIPSLFASLILIFNKSKFSSSTNKIAFSLYEKIAYLVLIIFFLMILIPERSTVFDRFAIYLVPITIYVFNKTIDLRLFRISRDYFQIIFITYFFLQSFLWLEFANFKDYFVPYKNILFL